MTVNGLSGLTVLEVADTLGAAFAVSLLADYNATAIVCEPAGGFRAAPAGAGHAQRDSLENLSAQQKNQLPPIGTTPVNHALIHQLLAHADLLVVDTAGDTASPWFKILETLPRRERPLVVEVFPTGADRPDLWPWSTRPEFAGAASGVMALTGHTGRTPIHAEAPLNRLSGRHAGGGQGADCAAQGTADQDRTGHGLDAAAPGRSAHDRMADAGRDREGSRGNPDGQ